jgi:hypothetical protein
VVLVNDWSRRDIRPWEYQPLGPFLGKSSPRPSRRGSCHWTRSRRCRLWCRIRSARLPAAAGHRPGHRAHRGLERHPGVHAAVRPDVLDAGRSSWRTSP